MTTYHIISYEPYNGDITIGSITTNPKGQAVLFLKEDHSTTYRPYSSVIAALKAVRNRFGWQNAYLKKQPT